LLARTVDESECGRFRRLLGEEMTKTAGSDVSMVVAPNE